MIIDKTTRFITSKGIASDVYLSSGKKSWRLVHDGNKVLALFESEGITGTINKLFVGTEKESKEEIKRLKLKPLEEV